ncbi:LamG-like jellyroll fold domain-containing protein [Longitalea luteola]|uniref:LamG-like jellyroll fold domain-containing protein n=1 Tax=Longitalea luteola TaxID=2812563 RepID=UPI001A96C6E2|nr:LamG-like jellyroll fold domain-containing protein [Longitalea luteola]
MQRFFYRLLLRLCPFCFLLFITNRALAIDERYAAEVLRGNQLNRDSGSTVTDAVYFNAGLKPLQTTSMVKNLITFQIDEQYRGILPDTFDVSVKYTVTYTYDNNGTPTTVVSAPFILNLAYSKFNKYSFKAVNVQDGWFKAEIKIIDITAGNGSNLNDFRDALMLTNEILVNREYSFSCTNNAIQAVFSDITTVPLKGELKVYWNTERAADEYDLEWSYIDDSALANYYISGSSTDFDARKIFTRNATRVSIRQEAYYIPLIYEGSGHLFYRVRAVQVKGSGQRIESVWSSDYAGGMGKYTFAGLDTSLNWQVSTSFAEEGKRKSVVHYFDGSLRKRQTVTKDNTTDTTIVAETLYDYQGQPAIQVMPAPSLSNVIKYTANFNSLNGAEYRKEAYDGMLIDSCYCKQGAPAMDNISGAANYYSPNNPLVNTGYHKYIPNANGFVFAETRYLPDNSGRISLQSGVGDQFQIGKGHETKYTYNSADQEELDALFGTEIGNAAHYFKNTVRDANGQVNITYVDMHGRTIATALAGFPAEKLDAIPSNKGYVITKNLIDNNTNIVKGRVIESIKGLTVTKAGPHRFRYSLLPDSISLKTCDTSTICYDCVYDLKITITDDCNNSTLPNGQPIVITKSNYRANVDTDCNPNLPFPEVDDTVFLREGSYMVTKTLTINKRAMDDYRNIFLSRNTCRSLERTIQEQKQLISQTISCGPGESVPKNLYASVREQMLADVTPPFGQYANPDNVDQYSIFARHQFRLTYTRVTDYKDENGNPDPLDPRSLSIPEFVKEFKSSWAVSLLPHHPEYPKLVRLNTLAASNAWDERFGSTQTWQAAVDSGFLNPGNFATRPAGSAFTYNFDHRDPFFTDLIGQGYVGAFYKSTMQNALVRAAEDANGAAVSMWSLATIMAHCSKDDLACFDQFKDLNAAFTMGADCSGDLDIAWRTFRDLYLQKKQELIADILRVAQNMNSEFFRDLTDLHNNHAPNFVDPTLVPTSNVTRDTTVAKAGLENYISNNCEAYATQWWNELQPSCKYSTADSAAIIPLLIQVCREGGDADHVYGASTVKPSSTNTYRSFEEVLKAYNQSAGLPYNASCNVYLISAPKPYDQQPVYYEKPLLQKPDDCECATINEQYQQYQVAGKDASFAAYLFRTSGTIMRNGALDTLRMACNGQVNCSFLKEPLKLPPALQCGVKDVCVNCARIDTLYQKYTTQFPDAVPRTDNTDSLQREKNKLFEQFMNSQLGFNKSTAEYMQFMDTCNIKKLKDTSCNVALQFNGAARQRVIIPNQTQIQRLDIGASDFTIEAKVKFKELPGNVQYPIISSMSSMWPPGKYPFDFFVEPNGDINFLIIPCGSFKATGNNLFDNKAHHIAVSRNGDSLAIYVDGVNRPVVSKRICGGPGSGGPISPAGNLSADLGYRIGSDSAYKIGSGPTAYTFPYGFFNGWMNYVRIWKKARTEAELAADKDNELAPQDGLVGNYIMESNDTCQQFVTDQSTDDSSLRNNAIIGEVDGKELIEPVWMSGSQIADNGPDPVGVLNKCSCEKIAPPPASCNVAMGFSAAAGQRVTIPKQNNRLSLGYSKLTIEAKIKIKSREGNIGYTIFATPEVRLIVNNRGLAYTVGECTTYETSGINLLDGKAHHVAVSTPKAGTVNLYIDGVSRSYMLSMCSGGPNTISRYTGNSYIGFDPITGSNIFNGWISYVRVWNKARTGVEIAGNMDSVLLPQDSLVGNYIMTSNNSCQQFVVDRSTNDPSFQNNGILGNSTDGEPVDPVWLSAGQISFDGADPVNIPNSCTCESVLFAPDTNCNKALQFSRNSRQRVLIPNPNERLQLGTGDFTMEAMIKPKLVPGVTAAYTIFSNRANQPSGVGRPVEGFELSITESKWLAITMQGCGLSYVYAPQLFDGKAHHVAVTRNVDTLGIYIDGVSKYSSTSTGCIIDSNNQQYRLKPSQLNLSATGNFYIGYDSLPNLWNQGFNGWMSYVRIWKKARTTAEIAGNMDKLLLPQNGLVGNFVLGSSNTCQQYVIDQSTNDPALRNNGIIGNYTGSEPVDPVWLSEAQLSFAGADPVNVANTCVCGEATNSELQGAKNEFINYYYNYGRKYDSDGTDTSTWKVNWSGLNINNTGVPHTDIFKNGAAQFPHTLSSSYGHQSVKFDFFGKDSACIDGYVKVEMRMKDTLKAWEALHSKQFVFYFSNPSTGTQQLVRIDDLNAFGNSVYNAPGYIDFATELQQNYTGPHTLGFEMHPFYFKFYLDGQLIKSISYPATIESAATRSRFYGMSVTSEADSNLSVLFDYIKCYDKNGRVFYNENFDDNSQFRLFDRYIACPRLPCAQAFTNWYNSQKQTNYTYSQLDSLYAASHMPLDICTPPLNTTPVNTRYPDITLCGKTEPVFPPADKEFTQHTPCADSTLFAWSTSVLIHEAYSDSLLGNFDDRYLAKCLSARDHEHFTVEQPISEFHYTLYYYNQAGNLIKTVPPEGVDVSKFAWASAWSDSVKAARKANQLLTPAHRLTSEYRYNTLEKLVAQKTPDGGLSEFWYDRLGRIAISRNARQRTASVTEDSRLYSYTTYDALGRIIEIGQVSNIANNGAMTDAVSCNESLLGTWLMKLTNRRGQITNTVYDLPYTGFDGTGIDMRLVITQRNLRNRVSYTTYTDTVTNNAYNQSTFYTYDVLGNVDQLLQDFGSRDVNATVNVMNKNENRWKKIAYKYDLISGNVNMVMYQPGWRDGFYHRYGYDADNRLTLVETSTDSLVWEKEARYEHYRHGPLARVVIGDQQVQGMDYAYTLQGWLKGINATAPAEQGTGAGDMGGDAKIGTLNQYTAKDALGLTLNYFTGDYAAINTGVMPFPGYSGHLPSGEYRPLFNGNISSQSVYQKRFDAGNTPGGPLIFYNYKYDQLNRLIAQDAYKGFNVGSNNWNGMTSMGENLKERIAYDANGNILKYLRKSISGTPADMDSLNYHYYANTNQLKRVTDNVPANAFPGSQDNQALADVETQADNNYGYDSIGNLIRDDAEKLTDIKWNVYGKIQEISKAATATAPATHIQYSYDAAGNRISEVVTSGGNKYYTWYVRDAQGNVLSTYTAEGNNNDLAALDLKQAERYMYGSKRLGVLTTGESMDTGPADIQLMHSYTYNRGAKQYELTNHLGNVLATVSDRKYGVSSAGSSLIDHYEPHIVNAQDYYPFGMMSRVANGKAYRFGFQGQMTDNEVKGFGNQIDFGFRVYDPRIGKFLSIDPLTPKYPQYSPYHFSSNQPNHARELEGLESEFDLTIPNSPGEVDLNHWKPNTQHRNPNGMSWVDHHGNKLFFDKAQYDANGKPLNGWKGVDHWHFENAEGQRFNADGVPNKSAKGSATHILPGTQTKIKIMPAVVTIVEEGIAATNAVAKAAEETVVSKVNGKVGGAMMILDVVTSFFGIASGDPDALINWFGTAQVGELKKGNIGGGNGNYFMIVREETKEWTENGVKHKEVTRFGQNYLHKGLTKDKKYIGVDPVGAEIRQTQSYENGKKIKTGKLEQPGII